MNKVRVYISHSIRGKDGDAATKETMEANNKKAIDFVRCLRESFSNVWFYCPAEHEDWIQRAYDESIITIENILDIDCDIVASCDILLVYSHDRYISGGMGQEIYRSHIEGNPVFIAFNVSDAVIFLMNELKRMMVG